jgi:hypothetical protein
VQEVEASHCSTPIVVHTSYVTSSYIHVTSSYILCHIIKPRTAPHQLHTSYVTSSYIHVTSSYILCHIIKPRTAPHQLHTSTHILKSQRSSAATMKKALWKRLFRMCAWSTRAASAPAALAASSALPLYGSTYDRSFTAVGVTCTRQRTHSTVREHIL